MNIDHEWMTAGDLYGEGLGNGSDFRYTPTEWDDEHASSFETSMVNWPPKENMKDCE